MTQKCIGILGGMGPPAGVYFAQQLIERNLGAKDDGDHPPFVLFSPFYTPNRAGAYINWDKDPVGTMADSLERLSGMGADFGVIICNTAHLYIDEIAARVSIPLLNMIENTAIYIDGMKKDTPIGLLATSRTVQSGLHARYLKGTGGKFLIPDAADQEIISNAIFDKKDGIKRTRLSASDRVKESIAGVAERMRERMGVEHLLLGCSELSFAIRDDVWRGFTIIDPVKLLADTCIKKAPVKKSFLEKIGLF